MTLPNHPNTVRPSDFYRQGEDVVDAEIIVEGEIVGDELTRPASHTVVLRDISAPPTVASSRATADHEAQIVEAFLGVKAAKPDTAREKREQAAARLAGRNLEEVARGYLAHAIEVSVKAKKKRDATAAAKAKRAASTDVTIAAGDLSTLVKDLPPVAGLAASASISFASDKWRHARNEPLPQSITGRLGRVVKSAVNDGADPIWVIRCASGIHDMAKVYDDAYMAAHGEAPTMRTRAMAVFAALDLSIHGRSWRLVTGALQMAAKEKSGFVERHYDALHAREGGRAYVAPGARPVYSVTDTVSAAIELLRAKNQKGAA